MPAEVDERLDAAVALSDHDDVVPRHLQGEEVAGAGDLGTVSDDRGDTSEDEVTFPLGHGGIGEFLRLEPGDVVEFVRRVVAQVIQGAANAFLAGGSDLGHCVSSSVVRSRGAGVVAAARHRLRMRCGSTR